MVRARWGSNLGRQLASVEKFWAWRAPEMCIGGVLSTVGIFEHQCTAQSNYRIHLCGALKRTTLKAIILFLLVSAYRSLIQS